MRLHRHLLRVIGQQDDEAEIGKELFIVQEAFELGDAVKHEYEDIVVPHALL